MATMTLKMVKGAVSMQQGVLAQWLVAEGDTVAVGQPIYAVETEKTTIEVESPFAGTIAFIAKEGETLPVGAPVARIET